MATAAGTVSWLRLPAGIIPSKIFSRAIVWQQRPRLKKVVAGTAPVAVAMADSIIVVVASEIDLKFQEADTARLFRIALRFLQPPDLT